MLEYVKTCDEELDNQDKEHITNGRARAGECRFQGWQTSLRKASTSAVQPQSLLTLVGH